MADLVLQPGLEPREDAAGHVFQEDKLLKMLGKPALRAGASLRVDGAERDHGEKEARRIVLVGSRTLGLPFDASGLAELRKADPRKVQLAILLRPNTTVSNPIYLVVDRQNSPGRRLGENVLHHIRALR